MTRQVACIAVVDDDERLLESLENMLESAGYAVRIFSSAQALLGAGLSGVDCVIADVGMPAMDGFELHAAVKRLQPELPVFLISGRHEITDHERACAEGIAGFFRKPFNGQTLLAAVGKALLL